LNLKYSKYIYHFNSIIPDVILCQPNFWHKKKEEYMELDKRNVAGVVGLVLLVVAVVVGVSAVTSDAPAEADAGVAETTDAGVETVGTVVPPGTTEEVVPASLETTTTSGGETTSSTTTSTDDTTTVVPLTTEVTVTSSTN
jgi:hypothetical protein